MTMLMVLALALPVMASDTITVNGHDYQSKTPLFLQQGTTMMPLEVLESVLGASVSTEKDNSILVKKNDHSLTLYAGKNSALLDGKKLVLSQAPVLKGTQVYVPLRSSMEALGAQVIWDPKAPLSIIYEEKRGDKTAEELMAESSSQMIEANSYRMDVKMTMDMDADIQAENEPPIKQSMAMDSDIVGYASVKPLQVYVVQNSSMKMKGQESPAIPAIKVETLINEKGIYTKMSGQEWMKIPIEGLDMQSLLQQSMTQDPVASMQLMKDMGMTNVFANDQERDGKKYWVIRSTADERMFKSEAFQKMMNVPGVEQPAEMKEIFDKIRLDMAYTSWINQESLYTDYMNLEGSFSIDTKVPDQKAQMKMDANIKADYKLSDFGKTITLPDVSNAKEMKLN